jgi:hypothetical protein
MLPLSIFVAFLTTWIFFFQTFFPLQVSSNEIPSIFFLAGMSQPSSHSQLASSTFLTKDDLPLLEVAYFVLSSDGEERGGRGEEKGKGVDERGRMEERMHALLLTYRMFCSSDDLMRCLIAIATTENEKNLERVTFFSLSLSPIFSFSLFLHFFSEILCYRLADFSFLDDSFLGRLGAKLIHGRADVKISPYISLLNLKTQLYLMF